MYKNATYLQEVTSGGGTGASQAFSEVGMDQRRDCAAPAQHPAGKGSGADDSGSSHASEPHARISTANQADPHIGVQHGTLAANVGAMSQWRNATMAHAAPGAHASQVSAIPVCTLP